ncbi:MAG: HEAT repeat domain-containing protein [Planctomycetaceae bacterium]|nr:HEAT repeat domain-containing protein [Planctomycetaceae bacterium]
MPARTTIAAVLISILAVGCSKSEPNKSPVKETHARSGATPYVAPATQTRPATATAPASSPATSAKPQAAYRGKTAAQWLELVVKPRDTDDRARVVDALNAIGAAAVPDLIVALRHPKYEVREEAAFALSRLQKDALPALAILIERYEDENFLVWEAIGTAVESVAVAAPKESLPALLAGLQSPRVKTRQGVLAVLRTMGPAAATAKDAVAKVRDADADSDTRDLAKEVLDAIGTE